MAIREFQNYGGRVYRTSTFTGEQVERAAVPTEYRISHDNLTAAFRLWEDVADFEADKKPFGESREFSRKLSELPQSPVEAIKAGALEFLELDSNYEFASIFINALDLTISVSAKHKTKDRFVNENAQGLEAFEAVKLEYLNSIVLPFIQMAWTLAASDRDLKKFND